MAISAINVGQLYDIHGIGMNYWLVHLDISDAHVLDR